MEKVLFIAIMAIFTSLLVGYTSQYIFEKVVEYNPKRGKPRISTYFPLTVKWKYWKSKIIILSLFSENYKLYIQELRKQSQHQELDKSFFDALITEKNPNHIDSIIETILQVQEKNRRKILKTKGNKLKPILFLRDNLFEDGWMKGLSIVQIHTYKVHYQRYLMGLPVPANTLESSIKYFGTQVEQTAIAIRNQKEMDEFNILLKSRQNKERQQFLDRQKIKKRAEQK